MVPVGPPEQLVVPDGGPVGPVGRVQGQKGQDRPHRSGAQRLLPLRPLDVEVKDVVEHEVGGGVVEGRDSGHELVETHPYRPPVHALVVP